MLDALGDLLLPSHCAICNRLPKPICDDCFQQIEFQLHVVTKQSISGKALLYYDEMSADLLNAFKERGQLQIARKLVLEVIKRVDKPSVDFLVPAPSSKFNFAVRGFAPAENIASQLSKHWQIPLLNIKLTKQLRDQADLSREARLRNISGAMVSPQPLAGKSVLLIDDIVTTGATLLEMARAVEEAGGLVSGFLALAETFPRTATKNSKRV